MRRWVGLLLGMGTLLGACAIVSGGDHGDDDGEVRIDAAPTVLTKPVRFFWTIRQFDQTRTCNDVGADVVNIRLTDGTGATQSFRLQCLLMPKIVDVLPDRYVVNADLDGFWAIDPFTLTVLSTGNRPDVMLTFSP